MDYYKEIQCHQCGTLIGKDVLMSDDLFQYIINVFENWNKGIKEKQYKIIKTDDGYDVEPIIQLKFRI